MTRELQQYEDRYCERHGTYVAYLDVWQRIPEAQHNSRLGKLLPGSQRRTRAGQ